MKYSTHLPKGLTAEQLFVIDACSDLLAKWNAYAKAQMLAAGVPLCDCGQVTAGLLARCLSASVIAYDDLEKRPVDVDGFGPFCSDVMIETVFDLRERRGN